MARLLALVPAVEASVNDDGLIDLHNLVAVLETTAKPPTSTDGSSAAMTVPALRLYMCWFFEPTELGRQWSCRVAWRHEDQTVQYAVTDPDTVVTPYHSVVCEANGLIVPGPGRYQLQAELRWDDEPSDWHPHGDGWLILVREGVSDDEPATADVTA